MKIRTIVKEVRLPYPPETVWALLLHESAWASWWYDDTPLTEVTPGWEAGATMHFGSVWAPSIETISPPNTLAFAGHRFELAEDGGADTILQWTNSAPSMAESEFDPMFLMEKEIDAQLAVAMESALDRFSAALEEFEVEPEMGIETDQTLPADSAADPLPREIRVFVSSTFRDLQAEREELSKRTFMELRRLCEERGVAWTDVDLRWGITDEQKAEGKVLPICLEEIENCRPYFIGILGERYGWVPEELPKDQADRIPWLTADRGRSITEMEIIHGVLNDPEMAPHAFFYFRDPGYIEGLPEEERPAHLETPTPDELEEYGRWTAEEKAEERRQRLTDLKARIESSGLRVRRFRTPQELAELVAEDLKGVVDHRYPAESAPGKREASALPHEAFIRESRRAFVPRPALTHRLDDHVHGHGGPMVVTGEAGSGKSAVLANWIHDHRDRFPTEPVIPHFVGAEAGGSAWETMLERFITELSFVTGQDFEAPEEPQALRQAFARALSAAAAQRRVTLVIDGLNELEDRDQALELAWMPPTIPEGVNVIVSTLPGRPLDEAIRRNWPVLEVLTLEPDGQIRLIHEYLDRYRKALSDEHVRQFLENERGGNPLFLRTVLEELRLHGDHATLGDVIDHYTQSPDLPGLFQKVLIRLERDYERDRPGLVRETLTLLSAARRGLTEDEILDLLGSKGQRLPRGLWSPLRLATEHLVSNRSGFLALRHEQLKDAVSARYLGTASEEGIADGLRDIHLRLANYFREREWGPRRTDELPWQLAQAEAWTELADLLGNPDFLEVAWRAGEFDVRRYWTQIEKNSSRKLVEQYQAVMDSPEPGSGSWRVMMLLESMGHWAEAQRITEAIGDEARTEGDQANLMASLGNEAQLLKNLGRWDEAARRFREQEQLARDLGHEPGLASALGGRAVISRVTGSLDEASRLYQEEEALRRKMGDQVGLQFCLGNQALVLVEGGDREGAFRLRSEQEQIAREIGHVDGLRMALESKSVLHRLKGDLDLALEMNGEAEQICRGLGDRTGLATTLINQGIILVEMGDPSRAFDRYREAEIHCRVMGERQGLATVLNNLASVLFEWDHIDEAETRWEECAEISRSLGYAMGLQAALNNLARIASLDEDREKALRLLDEQEAICREAGFPLELAQCLQQKGEALASLGRRDEAETAWAEARELVERHGLRKG